jgi:radical SAM-linked protein
MSQAENQMQSSPPARSLYRVRLIYARGEALRYVSHLDMQLVWERTLRRAGLPLAYSQGFSPRPRLHMASALPLGFLSRCEIADLWLDLPPNSPAPDQEELARSIQASSPPGLEIQNAEIVPLNLPALQTQVQSTEYLASPMDTVDPGTLNHAVSLLLAADTLLRERRGKTYDLRPLIEKLEVLPAEPAPVPGKLTLWMRLAAREGATGRPEEILTALGQDPSTWRVERVILILK